MSFREANLKALARFHPEAARLAALASPTGQGEWTRARSGAVTVSRRGIRLASAFDPEAEASRAVAGGDGDFAVLPGLGAGYLAEAVAARCPDLPLVVAEEDPAWFAEVIAHRDLSALWAHPFTVVLLGPDPAALGDFLRPLACQKVDLLSWRPLSALSPEWEPALAAQIRSAQAQARVNIATYRRFGALWRRNLAHNERQEARALSCLAGSEAGGRAVVAAAGPSLADALDWMRKRRDQFCLIAVDTAWPSLAANGLTPDFLLVLDGQYWNGRHVDLAPPERTLVVTEWIGPPRAFRLAPGRTYVAASSAPFLRTRETRLWGELGTLPSGGSVATAAWSLAELLGCSEVAFAGLDLGYPRGRSHVPGSQFQEAIQRRSFRLAPAETLGLGLRGWEGLSWKPSLDGGLVRSDARMDLFRDWLSAAVAARPEIRAVNLGTSGSLVAGLERAGPDYGRDWPRRTAAEADHPVLKPNAVRALPAPYAALARVLDDPGADLEGAWREAREYWGVAWDTWAGRAARTWQRWPSPRSRRALEEVLSLALEWEKFGSAGDDFEK